MEDNNVRISFDFVPKKSFRFVYEIQWKKT